MQNTAIVPRGPALGYLYATQAIKFVASKSSWDFLSAGELFKVSWIKATEHNIPRDS